MPNSLEAEQSVIGSMIMDKEAIMTAGEILIEEDFYHKQYGILFESMLDLFNAGEPVDLITLADVGTDVTKSLTNSRLLISAGTSFSFNLFCNVIRSKRRQFCVSSLRPPSPLKMNVILKRKC